MRRIISIVVVAFAMLILAACAEKKEGYGQENSDAESNAGTKVYAAVKIEKPTDAPYVESISNMSDGTVRITMYDGNADSRRVWDSKDSGETWAENTAGKEKLLSVTEDQGYKFSAEGELYSWNYENGLMDVSGRVIPLYEEEGDIYADSAFAGGILTVLIQNSSGNKIRQYYIDTGAQIDINNDALGGVKDDACQLTTDGSGKVIYLEGSDITRFDTESNSVETLIDRKEMTAIVPSEIGNFFGIAAGEGDELYLRVSNIDGLSDSLYRMSKGGTPEVSKTGLKVYTLKENPSLRQMIALYEEAYPNVKVELQVGCTGEDGTTTSDAVRSLNTEILAGEVPDVIVLDGLPVQQYKEKGILENVSEVVKQEKEVLFENIISACNNSESGIYVVPTSFTIPIIVGDKEVVQSENTEALVAELKSQDGNEMSVMSAGVFPVAAIDLFVTSDLLQGGDDNTKLKRFYENLKELFDLTMSGVSYEDLAKYYSLTDGIQFYPTVPCNDVALDIYLEEAHAGIVMLQNSDEYAKIASLCKEKGVSYDNLNQGAGNTFAPSLMLGISAGGNHKEEAKTFLKYYLTKLPENAVGVGFSVNKEIFKNNMPVSDGGEAYTKSSKKNQDLSLGLTVYKFTQEEFSKVEAFVEELDTPARDDRIIMECVMEQAQKYLYEGVGLDSAVNAAFEKINLYTKE